MSTWFTQQSLQESKDDSDDENINEDTDTTPPFTGNLLQFKKITIIKNSPSPMVIP